MSFAEVMKLVKSMDYSCIVFDTAPTGILFIFNFLIFNFFLIKGHTLRFLSFPTVLEKALSKFSEISGRFGPMISQMSGLMGINQGQDDMFQKLESMREGENF